MLSLKIDGAKVRRRRETQGVSVAQLAEAAGCSTWNIYKIEKGVHQPSAVVYASIRAALETTDEDLSAQNSEVSA